VAGYLQQTGNGFTRINVTGSMKLSMMATLVLVMALGAVTQTLQPVDNKSTVKFEIKNFGVNTGGDFKGLQGTIDWDAAAPEKCVFNISIDAATVNTGIDSRDSHLRKEEYFDVEKYPKIVFKSDKVTQSGNSFTVYGKLSIKGTTKDISIPFTATAKDGGTVFEGTFHINRKDYKIGGSSMVLGDNVTLSLSVFAENK
jgi:polyisoprenoid-binding protein YceI